MAHTHIPIITPHTQYLTLKYFTLYHPPPIHVFPYWNLKEKCFFWSCFLVFNHPAAGQELCYMSHTHGSVAIAPADERLCSETIRMLLFFSSVSCGGCRVPLWKQPKQSLLRHHWDVPLEENTIVLSFAGSFILLSLPWEWAQPTAFVQPARSWKLREAVIVARNRPDWQPSTSLLKSPECSSSTECSAALLSTSDSTSQGRKSLLPCFQHSFWLFSRDFFTAGCLINN